MSIVGTFETCPLILRTSVHRGRWKSPRSDQTDANDRAKADLFQCHSGNRQLKLLTYKPAYLNAKRSRERRDGGFRRARSGNDGSSFELFGDGDVFRWLRSSPGLMLRCTPVLFTLVPE
jgi:hypothetical protein